MPSPRGLFEGLVRRYPGRHWRAHATRRAKNASQKAKSKTAPEWAPLCYEGQIESGGAGIRTPVRDKIDHSVYVRSPPVEVSSRWPVGSPLLDELSKRSPRCGERTAGLSRICDTHNAASGGLHHGQVQQLLRVTQPVPGYRWQLKIFPEVLPGSEDLGTRPQLHQPRRSQSPPNDSIYPFSA